MTEGLSLRLSQSATRSLCGGAWISRLALSRHRLSNALGVHLAHEKQKNQDHDGKPESEDEVHGHGCSGKGQQDRDAT